MMLPMQAGASGPAVSMNALMPAQLALLSAEQVGRLGAALSLTQTARLLRIETALPSASLVVERCRVSEAVHAAQPLWAEVDCISTSAFVELKALTGEPVALHLLRADGTLRTWHGYAMAVAQLGADGGLARYRLGLRAWTHWLAQRLDSRIFQDLSAQDIITQVCGAYPQAHFRFEVAQPGPMRAITTQYRESDWAFVQRLMAAEGWSWRLEHQQGGAATGTAASTATTGPTPGTQGAARQARHCLVIFDEQAPRPQLGALRYSRPDVRQSATGLVADTLTAWRVGQRVGTNAATVAGWDERQIAGVAAQAEATDRGHVPALEHYIGQGERRHADAQVASAQTASSAVAQARAQVLLAAHQLLQHLAHGQGGVRAMQEGAQFTLVGHSRYASEPPPEGCDFVVLAVHHEAANNMGAQAAQLLSQPELEQGSYRNRFDAAPARARVLPMPPLRPTAPGPQTAIVVAAPQQPLTTDRDARIRVQFAWQRGAQPLPGALAAPTTPGGAGTGHAPGDSRSGTWVRVAQAVAGPNWGTLYTPRVGTEVWVDFIDGDIDRPVVVGQLYNGQHSLPWPAGVGSGANHPGTVSGWHSQHLSADGGAAEGANQWLIDDATGQLRMRLVSHSTATGHSELSLGHIIEQSAQGGAGQAQRGTWLGEGFYGHTQGWAVVRAGQGLLLSTSARPALGASVHSTQMDAAEAVAQLKAAQQLGQALSTSARQQGAQGLHSHDAAQALQQHTQAIDPQAQGKYTAPVGGQAPHKARPGAREGTEPVERFATPLIHIDTPASGVWVTPASVGLFSGQDTSLTAQGDTHITAAHTLSSVSGATSSLYTHAGGIKAIAASGPLSLRAHTSSQQVLAQQDITAQSTEDEIRIQAQTSITLTAGSSRVQLSGGNITFTCPGSWTVKAASHAWMGGGGQAAQLHGLPVGLLGEESNWLDLELRGWQALALPHVPYTITFNDGSTRKGVLDDQGLAHLTGVPKGAMHRVQYQNPPSSADPKPYTLGDLGQAIEQYLRG